MSRDDDYLLTKQQVANDERKRQIEREIEEQDRREKAQREEDKARREEIARAIKEQEERERRQREKEK